jgi:hypothetical protein
MPYGYYQLVRYLGMIAFIWLAYLDNKRINKNLFYFWCSSAILINPLFKIALGRTVWNVVDIIWTIVLMWTLFDEYRILRNNKRSAL